MAYTPVNLGTGADTPGSDSLHQAFTKVNQGFADLGEYAPVTNPEFLGSVKVPSWASAPSSAAGVIGFNTTDVRFEFGTGVSTVTFVKLNGDTLTGTLTLRPGTTAEAPLRFQAGALLTTPVAHTLEWDGTSLSVTNASNARKTLAYTDGNITGTAANVSGTVAVANGGTGAVTAAAALSGLGAAARGANSDITQLSGLTTALSVAQGGTGSTTAANARTALGAAPTASPTFTGRARVGVQALASGASVATDASLGNVFTLTLGANATLANPSNLADGTSFSYRIRQDATGSRTLAYGTAFKFPGGVAPTLSTEANALDILSCHTDGTNVYAVLTKDFR